MCLFNLINFKSCERHRDRSDSVNSTGTKIQYLPNNQRKHSNQTIRQAAAAAAETAEAVEQCRSQREGSGERQKMRRRKNRAQSMSGV